ncbi:hypothetical protein LJR231_001339 [Phyllobacterium sp. LjRoot231]|uniref:hypothetical protein n=1 Tax=Phyllobacterium sp. LjRoot231 TaxID=3342289 RepID=UPI003ED12616
MRNTNTTLYTYLFKERSGTKHSATHASNLTKVMLMAALVAVVSMATPVRRAEAQSASLDLGYPSDLKAGGTKKKITKGRSTISTKIIKASYLGRAPYICTPSGFGRTSRCFAR